MKFLPFLFLCSCASMGEKSVNTAIICPEGARYNLRFCDCFVPTKTLEEGKQRYIYIKCSSVELELPKALSVEKNR